MKICDRKFQITIVPINKAEKQLKGLWSDYMEDMYEILVYDDGYYKEFLMNKDLLLEPKFNILSYIKENLKRCKDYENTNIKPTS